MKKKLLLLFILSIGFGIFLAAKFFFFKSKDKFGQLTVLSSPEASVFLNDLMIGRTPVKADKIKAGEHLIKLIPEGVATDTASWKGKIKVTPNSLTFVSFDLGSSDVSTAGEIFYVEKLKKKGKKGTGEIFVQTEPAGAIVYLNNDEKGIAPLKLVDVPQGEHELSVYLPGFFKRTRKVLVNEGYRLNAYFKLAIDKSQQERLKKLEESTKEKEATEEAKAKTFVKIRNTPTGWLRVRSEPSLGASESAKIKVGAQFELLDEQKGWYKIRFNGKEEDLVSGSFEEGWISSRYAEKVD